MRLSKIKQKRVVVENFWQLLA